ncbi:hypothetical protein ACFV30_28255 [Streptomyces sp. NPDC059752]|uniref:hypothetical protein n=1 Tax=unclassified Streptomyces TaxID=2593676 RepID=UPI003654963B
MAVTSSVAGIVTVARPGSTDLTARLRWTIAVQAVPTLPLLAVSGLWGGRLRRLVRGGDRLRGAGRGGVRKAEVSPQERLRGGSGRLRAAQGGS